MIDHLHSAVGLAVDARLHQPSHARFLWRQIFHVERNDHRDLSDRDHLEAAVRWIDRAQDVTDNGGITGRYSLTRGWNSSYPETTGYLIPTLLDPEETQLTFLVESQAGAALDFLLRVQLSTGAFPGGGIAENRTEPSVFSTGQVIRGLLEWHRRKEDEAALEAALTAGRWMASVQDPDGAWRRHIYEDVPTSHMAFPTGHRASLGHRTGDLEILMSARNHLLWVWDQRNDETGRFGASGFTPEDHRRRRAVTHTMAYTLLDFLHASRVLEIDEGIDAARRPADRVLHRREASGWPPGVSNHRWVGEADYACLTRNVQMALIWLELYRLGNI